MKKQDIEQGANTRKPELVEHANAIRALGRQTVKNLVEIGERLSKCRAILKEDGSWRDWLEQELRLSPQSAGRFIQAYEQRSNLEHLDLPVSAVYLLAAPSTPESARQEIIERAEQGEPITVAKVKETVARSRQKARPLAERQLELQAQSRIVTAATKPKKKAAEPEQLPDDTDPNAIAPEEIAPSSSGELWQLRQRISELENENRLQQFRIKALESEIEELKAGKPPADPSSLVDLVQATVVATNTESSWPGVLNKTQHRKRSKAITAIKLAVYELQDIVALVEKKASKATDSKSVH